MCHPLSRTIVKLEQHWIGNVQSGKLVQCAGRHDDFATMVHILSLRSRKHRYWIAAIIFIEATGSCARARHAGT